MWKFVSYLYQLCRILCSFIGRCCVSRLVYGILWTNHPKQKKIQKTKLNLIPELLFCYTLEYLGKDRSEKGNTNKKYYIAF